MTQKFTLKNRIKNAKIIIETPSLNQLNIFLFITEFEIKKKLPVS